MGCWVAVGAAEGVVVGIWVGVGVGITIFPSSSQLVSSRIVIRAVSKKATMVIKRVSGVWFLCLIFGSF